MLFNKLFRSLKAHNSNDPQDTNRSYVRRGSDQCVLVIGGQIFPVQDWSMGGTLIRADERHFALSDEMGITIKFKLGGIVRDVTQLARVVRKAQGLVAFEFPPLSYKSRRDFQSIMNDCITTQFADSQRA